MRPSLSTAQKVKQENFQRPASPPGLGRWIDAVLILGVIGVALFFRTHELRLPVSSLTDARGLARAGVMQLMSRKWAAAIEAEQPGMPNAVRERLAGEQAERTMAQDPAGTAKLIDEVMATMPSYLREKPRHYLQEADPYHYYDLTRTIDRTGRISDQIRDGLYFNPRRHAPHGLWSPVNWHPYLGAAWHSLVRFFKPGVKLMDSCAYFSLVLTAWVVVSFYFLCRVLGCGKTGFVAGGVTLVLAPIFLQRSLFGWYDTDPYNLFFPFVVLALFFAGAASKRHAVPAGLAAGLVTGVYAMFWIGWPFIFMLVAGAAVLMTILRRFNAALGFEGVVRFAAAYGLTALAAVSCLMTPATAWKTVVENSSFLSSFAAERPAPWPNVFVTVGEARSISLPKLVFLSGNPFTWAVALAGLCWIVSMGRSGNDPVRFGRGLAVAAIALPLLVLALRTERFSLLFVAPLSVFVAWGADALLRLLRRLAGRFSSARWVGTVCLVLIFLWLLPVQIILAQAIAMHRPPIMNNAWYMALGQLQEKSPPDTIVVSDWTPGHFIPAIAERRSVVDGGTQYFPEYYWICRAFISPDERETRGILRMLAAGGNRAAEFLLSRGWKLSDAVDFLNEILILNRGEAARLAESRLGAENGIALLKWTHGDGPLPPLRLLVFHEMIEKNLSMTLMARWNFHTAENTRPGGRGARAYVHDMVRISDGVLKYRPEAPLLARDGDALIFANGLRYDPSTSKALISLPAEGVSGMPLTVFRLEDGKLVETPTPGPHLDTSALVFSDGGVLKSVLADRRLLASILYRLYYLRGEGLESMRLAAEQRDPDSGTVILIYEVAGWSETASAAGDKEVS